MNTKFLVYCSVRWLDNKKKKIGNKYKFFYHKKDLNFKLVKKYNPKYIFFPHWNYKIPKKIIDNFFCIIFHTAPLPYGRGGSPIQNLIKRGFSKSPIYALKANNKLDSGKIIMSDNISLNGKLDDIFFRMSDKTFKIIKKIEKKNKLNLRDQKGKIKIFKRLSNKENSILENNLKKIHDKIRMLDSEFYPKAHIFYKKIKVDFFNSKIKNKKIYCNSIISLIKR